MAQARQKLRAAEGRAQSLKPKPHYYVQVFEAIRGGGFRSFTPVRFETIEGAIEICEQLQQQFDSDCEPCRVYVLDEVGVPLHAGGAKVSKGLK